MIDDILHAAKYGGDQAEAAARGDGKTTIAECVIILLICFGVLRFPVIFSATGRDAEQILSNIKAEFETNDMLCDDFPEVCIPIRALGGAPQRAGAQTVDGKRTRIQWSGDRIVFPTVKGSKASGAVLMTRGLDGAVRGLRHGSMRPDFVLIDDPDTEESAESPSQQEKREKTIEKAIGGLAGVGKRMGRLMLCTLINRTCLAAKYTDPKQKPSWRGKRFKLLAKPPERDDLWGEYIRLRQEGFDPNSETPIDAACKFYLDNRDAMDAGAVVSNPYRYVADAVPPEYSALQHCYNIIADKGWSTFLTEYNNDPPEEEGPQSSGITPALVAKRLSGYPMLLVPRGRLALTGYIDVGESKGCHFVVIAWYSGARGHIIEYGVQDVHNIATLGPEIAVKNALRAWREERLRNPYMTDDGQPAPLDLVLVDAGDGALESTVFSFVREAGLPFRASKGFGSNHGMSPFSSPQRATKDRRPGQHWYESRQPSGIWLVGLDVDYWKGWVHDRFMTQHLDEQNNLRPGSLSIFGDDERRHHTFSRHITSEIQEIELVRGKGLIRRWRVRSRNNDWLDCTAGAAAAAHMLGVTLEASALPPRRAAVRSRTSGWLSGSGGSWI